MGNNVFANGREISCKKADGKSICAFPDVCMTPPENPATPPGVPVPYPNTGMAKDMTSGTKKVNVSSKEVVLKNKSYFKKSIGDEAGCAAKKGVVTSVNRGKVYFISWSMDVKFEGQNVVRHLDMATHNHASPTTNTPPWPYVDSASLEGDHPCAKYAKKVKEDCPPPEKSKADKQQQDFIGGKLQTRNNMPNKKFPPGPQDNTSPACCDARKCMLVPEHPKSRCKECGKTPHHPIPVGEFSQPRKPKGASGPSESRGRSKVGKYKSKKAPCMCVEGEDHDEPEDAPPYDLKEHGLLGQEFTKERNKILDGRKEYEYQEASQAGAKAVNTVTGCDEQCMKAQLDKGHEAMEIKATDKVRKSKQKAQRDPKKTPKPKSPSI
jgi:hypothetical protein